MTTIIQAYIASQNALRGNTGANPVYAELDYDASAGAVIAGENAVIGFQSANLTSDVGANGVLGNSVVLGGLRDEYAIQVDSTGSLSILDVSTGLATSGQNISVTGDTYVVFGAAVASTGGFSDQSVAFIENATGSEVAALYQAALGRIPDLQGLEYWQAQYAAGMTMASIAEGFLNAPEFASHIVNPTTSTDAQFVTALYQNVLGRDADPSGDAYWLAQLATAEASAGYSEVAARASVLLGFTSSTENMANISMTNGGWLIDTATGGYADTANPIPIATALSEAIQDGNLNLGDLGTTVVHGSVGTQGDGPYISVGGVSGAPVISGDTGVTIHLTSFYCALIDTDVGDFIYGPSAGGAYIIVDGSNNTVYLSGTSNTVDNGGLGTIVYGFNSTDMVSTGGLAVTSPTVYTPTSANPLHASSIASTVVHAPLANVTQFNSTVIVDVGSVGGGSAAEVATAANAVYVLAGVPGEDVQFMGETSSGNAILYAFRNPLTPTTTVHASELSTDVTLVGVAASSLTAANFHS